MVSPTGHGLPGHDDRLLVGDIDGKLAVIHVGEHTTRRDVTAPFPTSPVVTRSRAGKFFLVYDAARTLVRVDPATAAIEASITLPLDSPTDVEFIDDAQGYVASKTEARVARFELDGGAELASIDLHGVSAELGTIDPRRMKAVGTKLFVQIARTGPGRRPARGAVAVIDTVADRLEAVLELEGRDDGSGELIAGLEPDLPLVFDAKRKRLFVTATGSRPSNTGLLATIDPEALVVDRVDRSVTFQGTLVFDRAFESAFFVEHTSTPVTSSHLRAARVDDAGDFHKEPDVLVDAFDGLDAISMNADGTVLAMANTCMMGCVAGAGVNFIEVETRKVLPKLTKESIGFEPSFVEFDGPGP